MSDESLGTAVWPGGHRRLTITVLGKGRRQRRLKVRVAKIRIHEGVKARRDQNGHTPAPTGLAGEIHHGPGLCPHPCLWESARGLQISQLSRRPAVLRVPAVVQQKRIQLGSTRLQVRSLVLLSGLGIRHCRELWCRPPMRLRSNVAVAVV